MTYLVDSDWVADWLAGKPEAIRLITKLSAQGIAVRLITFGEIYEGIYFGRDPDAAEAGFQKFLREVDVPSLSRRIVQRFARLRGELRRIDQLIPDPDILIAATALRHNLTLLTRNVKDFRRIPGLELYPDGK